jgi:hypothetical protein
MKVIAASWCSAVEGTSITSGGWFFLLVFDPLPKKTEKERPTLSKETISLSSRSRRELLIAFLIRGMLDRKKTERKE